MRKPLIMRNRQNVNAGTIGRPAIVSEPMTRPIFPAERPSIDQIDVAPAERPRGITIRFHAPVNESLNTPEALPRDEINSERPESVDTLHRRP